MKLQHSREVLQNAISELMEVKLSKELEKYQRHWKNFLHCLEQTWIKAERECQYAQSIFRPIQELYRQRRKTEPLLLYLQHARHANEHSIQELLLNKSHVHVFVPGKKITNLHISSEQDEIGNDKSVKIKYGGKEPIQIKVDKVFVCAVVKNRA